MKHLLAGTRIAGEKQKMSNVSSTKSTEVVIFKVAKAPENMYDSTLVIMLRKVFHKITFCFVGNINIYTSSDSSRQFIN